MAVYGALPSEKDTVLILNILSDPTVVNLEKGEERLKHITKAVCKHSLKVAEIFNLFWTVANLILVILVACVFFIIFGIYRLIFLCIFFA